MKNLKLFFALFAMLALGVGNAWAESVEMSSFSATSADMNNYISYKTAKGGGTSNPAVNDSQIRLYQGAPGGNITISAKEGVTITEVTIGSGMATQIRWEINGTTDASNTSLAKNAKTTKSGISTKSITCHCYGSDKNSRLYVNYLKVVYTIDGGVTPDPCTTPTVAWNTKPANGEVGGSMTASVTTNYSNGLTYSSSNQTVATVTDAGVINYLSAGNTTITATVTGDGTTICEGPVSVQQEITVTAPAGGDGSDGECSWTLVADASTLKVDDEIIIAASGDNNYALSTNQKSSNRGGTPITKNGNTLTAPSADVQILTLKAGSTSGTFAFYTGASGYLYAASSSGNQLKTKSTLDVHGSWTISITDGVASIAAKGSSNRNVMQYNYNNGSPLFACYASASQTSLAIYKKICSDDGGDDPEPVKTLTSIEITTPATQTTFWQGETFNHNGLVVTAHYSDAADEVVTPTVTGSTATAGTATVNVSYKEQSTSYTITVKAIPNTKETAYTVADAYDIIDKLTTAEGVFISGTISQVDSYSDQYKSITYWISADGTTTKQLQVYSGKGLESADFDAVTNLSVGDQVIVCGDLKKYKETYEFDKNNYLVSHTPTTKDPAGLAYATTSYTANVGEAFTTPELTNPHNLVVTYSTSDASKATVNENTGAVTIIAAGTVTITASTMGDASHEPGSASYTITISNPAMAVATLPFTFNSGKADIENTAGMTQNGLGSDYSANTAPNSQLKFDGTGDWVVIRFDSEPGKLSYDIKNNSFSEGTFSVQESADGETYTNVAVHTEITETQSEEHKLLSTSRYVKFIYTEKVNGNVGLGNIQIAKPDLRQEAGIAWSTESVEITVGEDFTAPTLSNPNGLTLNCTSDNEDLVTVTNAGVITLKESVTGTAIITATFAGNEDYKPAEVSCTITVNALTTYTVTFDKNGHGATTTQTINSGEKATEPKAPTATGYTFGGWYTEAECTNLFDFNTAITGHITLYAKWTLDTYTVTFNAGSGTCTTESTTGNYEDGITTLPTATPCDYASTNGWSFVGWSESTVSETTVRPAIHTGNYKPTKNITLHAVYAKTGTAQGGAGEFILSLQYGGTTYYVGQTFDNSKLSAETEQTNAARFTIEDNYLHYEGGYISHVATTNSPDITKQADKANAQAWTITEEINTIIFTSTADNTRGLGFNYNNGSPRFAAYKLNEKEKDGETIKYPSTFTKTSVSDAAIDVTTYNSNPSCNAPVNPTWVAAEITHTAIKANCGSTTVLGSEGENGPATISFSGTDLQNSVTVTASDGFLVSTAKTDSENYAKSVIIYPNSTGNNIGKITQGVHVIANATAKNESYTGTITLTGADITNGPQVINVTAAVTCTQYTITWSVNGDDSHQVTYSPGDALQLPEIDITPCDDMNHVGWTDNMGYDHGTDILFTETTDMTVTGNQTYYAVFATSTSSDDGAETTLDFTDQGYANQTTVTSLTINAVTVTFSKGTNNNNPPKYYTSGEAVRAYGGNTFTVSSDNTIIQITITFGSSDGTNEITTDSGDYSDGTWTGSANNITFTIGGTSGNRRIQSITVISAGGGASYYTDYTTTCEGRQLETPTNLQATDITYNGATLTWGAVAGANKYKVVINGTEYISNTNSYTTHDLKPQTAYTWTVQAIGNGTTFTDSEISEVATFPTGTALTITWSVSTVTSTTTITKGQPIGANLKTPATPAACEGKSFMGWSASSTVKSDGSDFTPITSDIVPETNVTYYAVFAKKEVGDGVALTQCNGSTTFETGDNIVIVASGDGWSYLCYQKTSGTTYIVNHEFTNNATTLIEDDKNYWTLETANGGFYLGDNTNGYMYIPTSNNLCVSTENKSTWTIEWNPETSAFNIKSDRWLSCRSDLETDNKYKWRGGGTDGTSGTTNLQIYKISGSTSYTDYSTSCGMFIITYYGFNSGGYTTTCNDNPAVDEVEQGGTYVIPNCEPTFDPAELGRTFAGTWNTQANGKGTAYKPGDEIVNVSNDITLYAQWTWNTNTIPTDDEGIGDLATTDIVVTGGNTLTLAEGTTTINSLTLKGGWQADSTYAMPVVNIPEGATLVRNNNKINLDLKVNNNSYYPFAVPFEVANTSENVNYLDTTLKKYANANYGYGKFYEILEYNGALRAENGVNSKENWVHVGRHTPQKPSYLVPGKGYAISAVPAAGKDTVTIRITMNVSNDWLANGEQFQIDTITRNAVKVVAHKGTAATEHQRHAGWNFVANPYLTNFTANENISGAGYINGKIIINDGNYSYGGDEVPYVTIPTYNFAHYYQLKLSEATLSPAYSFFVQVGEGDTMSFDVAGRQAAPAGLAARSAEERPVKMDVDITLSDNHSSDQTGIIISDRYSEAYEIGRDLEKLFGSAYNLSVYTLMADNTPLAFQALAIRSNMQVIPVGYRAPEQGEYTFRLNEATSSIDLLNEQYEQLVLVDYQTGELTNLLISDYTFYSERTQADNRFAIYAVPRQNTPTDLPNAIGQDKQAQKIIHNGHLYILRDGNVYNGNGQIVK